MAVECGYSEVQVYDGLPATISSYSQVGASYLIIDGNSEMDAHAWCVVCNLFFFRHLLRSTLITNLKFLIKTPSRLCNLFQFNIQLVYHDLFGLELFRKKEIKKEKE